MSGLPHGWVLRTIAELLGPDGIFSDGDWIESKDQDKLGEVRLIQLADLGDGQFLNKSNRFMSKITANELNCTFLEENDILVARMPEPLGRSLLFPLKEKEKFVTVVDIAIIRLKNPYVNVQYLSHCLNSPQIRRQILELQTGTTRKRISKSNLGAIKLPIAPLTVQNKIVEVLEELLSRADSCYNDLQLSLNRIKFYEQSLLKYTFAGNLSANWRKNNTLVSPNHIIDQITIDRNEKIIEEERKYITLFDEWQKSKNGIDKPIKPKKIKPFVEIEKDVLDKLPLIPADWKWCSVSHILDLSSNSIKAGPFGSSLKKESYISDGPFKVYGQEQVIAGDSNLGTYFISHEKYKELIACSVRPGDILISLVGTVGKVLILPANCQPGIINPRLIKISLNLKYYNPKFFKYYFESLFLKSLYSGHTHGATMDVLNLGIIEKLPFPILSLEEQDEIVKELDSQFSAVDYLSLTLNNTLEKIDNVKSKIVFDAFNGKLINYEIATESIDQLLNENLALRNEKLITKPKVKSKRKEKIMENKGESLIEILRKHAEPISAKDLWLKSNHRDNIEEFYAELKDIANIIDEVRAESKSLISIKNENQ